MDTLHSHMGADFSAASVLGNWKSFRATMRARMSHLSCKLTQPLFPAAQQLGTLYILFRLGASYCLVA